MLLISSMFYLPSNGRQNSQKNAHMKLDVHHLSARNLFYVMGRIHTMLKESKNRVFIVKTNQILFRSHHAWEIWKRNNKPVILNVCSRKTRTGRFRLRTCTLFSTLINQANCLKRKKASKMRVALYIELKYCLTRLSKILRANFYWSQAVIFKGPLLSG